ncbi:Ig-like domain-containing protein [Enterobacter hormaechei]
MNGTGEPGTTITLYSGTTVLGTALVSANGQWSITLETALPDGGHVLTATAVDARITSAGHRTPGASRWIRRAGRAGHYAGH